MAVILNPAFVAGVQALAVVMDIRTNRSISGRVVVYACRQDPPAEDIPMAVDDFVKWQYGNGSIATPRPAWVKKL